MLFFFISVSQRSCGREYFAQADFPSASPERAGWWLVLLVSCSVLGVRLHVTGRHNPQDERVSQVNNNSSSPHLTSHHLISHHLLLISVFTSGRPESRLVIPAGSSTVWSMASLRTVLCPAIKHPEMTPSQPSSRRLGTGSMSPGQSWWTWSQVWWMRRGPECTGLSSTPSSSSPARRTPPTTTRGATTPWGKS